MISQTDPSRDEAPCRLATWDVSHLPAPDAQALVQRLTEPSIGSADISQVHTDAPGANDTRPPGLYELIIRGRREGIWLVLSERFLVHGFDPVQGPDALFQALLDLLKSDRRSPRASEGLTDTHPLLLVIEWPSSLALRSTLSDMVKNDPMPPKGAAAGRGSSLGRGEKTRTQCSSPNASAGTASHNWMPANTRLLMVALLTRKAIGLDWCDRVRLVFAEPRDSSKCASHEKFAISPPVLFEDWEGGGKALERPTPADWIAKARAGGTLSARMLELPSMTSGMQREGASGVKGRLLEGWLDRSLQMHPAHPLMGAEGGSAHASASRCQATTSPGGGVLLERCTRRWYLVALLLIGLALPTVAGGIALWPLLPQLPVLSRSAPRETLPPSLRVEAPAPVGLCTSDDACFVQQLRCQIGRFAGSDFALDRDTCSALCASPLTQVEGNFQPVLCGLFDRERENWLGDLGGKTYRYAEQAVSQACFQALGQPVTYAREQGGRERWIADPARMLEQTKTRIDPLVQVLDDLKAQCEQYSNRLEQVVRGAQLAAMVGPDASSGPESLREKLIGVATREQPEDLQKCFVYGSHHGWEAIESDTLCGEAAPGAKRVLLASAASAAATRGTDLSREEAFTPAIWRKLAAQRALTKTGHRRDSLVGRYVEARFKPRTATRAGPVSAAAGEEDDPGTREVGSVPAAGTSERPIPSLWECHYQLTGAGALPLVSGATGSWGLPPSLPQHYGTRSGLLTSQLELDSALLALRGGTDLGQCWKALSEPLTRYAPVHPLFEGVDPKGWPDALQQVCGRVCEAYYQLSTPVHGDLWWTPAADLERCLPKPDLERCGSTPEAGPLVVPWRKDWSAVAPFNGASPSCSPTPAQACALHLVAQGIFTPGTPRWLPGNITGIDWAGEASPRIAGGGNGQLARAVNQFSHEGLKDVAGRTECGAVATMCFATLALESRPTRQRATGGAGPGRTGWLPCWDRAVAAMARGAQSAEDLENDPDAAQCVPREAGAPEPPWCGLIRPYLAPGPLHAEIDTPCRLGVEDARKGVARAIVRVEAGPTRSTATSREKGKP